MLQGLVPCCPRRGLWETPFPRPFPIHRPLSEGSSKLGLYQAKLPALGEGSSLVLPLFLAPAVHLH